MKQLRNNLIFLKIYNTYYLLIYVPMEDRDCRGDLRQMPLTYWLY